LRYRSSNSGSCLPIHKQARSLLTTEIQLLQGIVCNHVRPLSLDSHFLPLASLVCIATWTFFNPPPSFDTLDPLYPFSGPRASLNEQFRVFPVLHVHCPHRVSTLRPHRTCSLSWFPSRSGVLFLQPAGPPPPFTASHCRPRLRSDSPPTPGKHRTDL